MDHSYQIVSQKKSVWSCLLSFQIFRNRILRTLDLNPCKGPNNKKSLVEAGDTRSPLLRKVKDTRSIWVLSQAGKMNSSEKQKLLPWVWFIYNTIESISTDRKYSGGKELNFSQIYSYKQRWKVKTDLKWESK